MTWKSDVISPCQSIGEVGEEIVDSYVSSRNNCK